MSKENVEVVKRFESLMGTRGAADEPSGKRTLEKVLELLDENVVFRPLDPVIMTEGCVAWRNENPSSALQAYIRIVEQAGSSLR